MSMTADKGTPQPADSAGISTIVALTALAAHPENPRTDLGDLAELAASIAAQGLFEPLIQFYEHVDVEAAGFFGLLPGPDRGGGRRWSAATAEDIRARWPEISAASRCIGAYGLRERGWTEAMIRDLLGKPDRKVDNPHYKSAGQMRLWRLQRVEAAEVTPEFAQRKERADLKRTWRALGGYGSKEETWLV